MSTHKNTQQTQIYGKKSMGVNGGQMEVEVERVFIGAGCNRTVNNVSWGACDLVSFGAQNAVAIFCPETSEILTTLPGHKAFVNCTQWVPSSKFSYKAANLERHYLLSGDADGAMFLWEFSLPDKKWRNVLQVPQEHKKGITCLSAIMLSQTDALLASSSSDGIASLWELILPPTFGGECELSCLDILSVGRKPMVALSLAELPGNSGQLALAMGGLNNNIQIYTGHRTGKFVHACELKGHTDWVRSLDFSSPIHENGEKSTLLVSSSQDKGIRVWKMALLSPASNRNTETTLSSYIKGPIFSTGPCSYQISLESLLVGHEDWVYSVQWQPPQSSTIDGVEIIHQPPSILSASMDKTMMIWQPEKTSGIWMNVVSVGELGHCALGFYGGQWSPSGDSILANGYGGSFHMWKNVGIDFDDWKPQKVPSGHFAAVSDISWAAEGEYLLSVSHDQTSRIFSAWHDESSQENTEAWHEIARPQVHGHDINCATIIGGKGNHRFLSGADEKVARVFEAPLPFLKTLNRASSQKWSFGDGLPANVQILGANMSALGLSQKPIYVQASSDSRRRINTNEGIDSLETVPEAVPVELTEPPIEEQLAWHTLWPETHKLYGHGNELFSMCCDRDGKLVASSCKAQVASVAEIWLWQVGPWKAVGRLHSHNLTVTQLEFSHDSKFLLSVSRDRHFSIFSIIHSDEISHQLVIKQEAHKRIIWACSWSPFGHEFATGSRDKTVKIWRLENGSSVELLTTLPTFDSSVTAVSWAGLDRRADLELLAIGLESGVIELWSLSGHSSPGAGNLSSAVVRNAARVARLDPYMCHVSSVRRLRWQNAAEAEGLSTSRLQLASCGDDHCVRVYRVRV